MTGLLFVMASFQLAFAQQPNTPSPDSTPLTVQVTTLDGSQYKGTLQSLSSQELVVKTASETKTLAIQEVLSLNRPDAKLSAFDTKQMSVHYQDGSRLSCSNLQVSSEAIAVESPEFGKIECELKAVSHLRFQPLTEELSDKWQELTSQETRKDRVIVLRKGNVFDYIEGVIGDIDEKSVKFLLNGNEIPIKREKVFGLIYAHPEAKSVPLCKVTLTGSQVVQADQIKLQQGKVALMLGTGAEIVLPLHQLASLDFSQLKIQYLSELKPDQSVYTPFFSNLVSDQIYGKPRINKNFSGKVIKIDGKPYKKGLCIHSKTVMKFRLASEYRRFQATTGIEYEVARQGLGEVYLIIKGDDRVLFEKLIKGGDKPQKLDLDVTNVRFLELRVEYDDPNKPNVVPNDVADQLALGDAKLVK